MFWLVACSCKENYTYDATILDWYVCMNMYTNTVYTCCRRTVACNCMSCATCFMQLHVMCNLFYATAQICSCMCRMQLNFNCMRQLQNPKFLVVNWHYDNLSHKHAQSLNVATSFFSRKILTFLHVQIQVFYLLRLFWAIKLGWNYLLSTIVDVTRATSTIVSWSHCGHFCKGI
jgi:hypothetical protein